MYPFQKCLSYAIFITFRSARKKLHVTVFFDHPVEYAEEQLLFFFQVGIFRSDPFVSPSTHQFEFISTFAPFPILPRRPIYFSSNNHQTSSHKSYLPTTPIIANWRRSGARKSVDAAPNHGCEKIRRRNKYDRKFVTNPL